jgi:hypothetical protein
MYAALEELVGCGAGKAVERFVHMTFGPEHTQSKRREGSMRQHPDNGNKNDVAAMSLKPCIKLFFDGDGLQPGKAAIKFVKVGKEKPPHDETDDWEEFQEDFKPGGGANGHMGGGLARGVCGGVEHDPSPGAQGVVLTLVCKMIEMTTSKIEPANRAKLSKSCTGGCTALPYAASGVEKLVTETVLTMAKSSGGRNPKWTPFDEIDTAKAGGSGGGGKRKRKRNSRQNASDSEEEPEDDSESEGEYEGNASEYDSEVGHEEEDEGSDSNEPE